MNATDTSTKEKTETAYCEMAEPMELKIGGTTYILTGKYKEKGEGLLHKLWRLIENDNS